MTTIAYDGKTLVTDSQVTVDGKRFGKTQKLFRLHSRAVLAISGTMDVSYEIMRWLNGDAEKPALDKEQDDFEGLLIEPDGSAWEIAPGLRRFPACVPWTGGTGGIVAMTAMRCGKTAQEAVELACEIDTKSGGPLQIHLVRT